jgi:DNA-binding NarL/FixJ family response regulator
MPATMLVVEDHDTVRQSLRFWLEVEFPHCRVLEAASGEEAIRLVQIESPELVVMDIKLPGMSGIEATRQIKATLPSTQVVILTMYANDAFVADATAAGASAYVLKEAMHTELVPTLAAFFSGDCE